MVGVEILGEILAEILAKRVFDVAQVLLEMRLANGRIGLVGYWDVVAFDEFAGREKTANKALVDIMKNYMANKTFSRGVNPMGAEASFAFVGNTDHNVPFMLKNSDLFEALPSQFHVVSQAGTDHADKVNEDRVRHVFDSKVT